MHTHIACFEGEKKAQKNLPPAAGETPDPCHLSGPEMISYTFRHHTPSDTKHLGLPGGAAGAMDIAVHNTTVKPSFFTKYFQSSVRAILWLSVVTCV